MRTAIFVGLMYIGDHLLQKQYNHSGLMIFVVIYLTLLFLVMDIIELNKKEK